MIIDRSLIKDDSMVLTANHSAYLSILFLFKTVRASPFDAVLLHLLAHRFSDVDAFTVEPVLTRVATYHKAIVVRLSANTPKPAGENMRININYVLLPLISAAGLTDLDRLPSSNSHLIRNHRPALLLWRLPHWTS